MPWFKVDDNFHSNKKVLRIPRSRRCAAAGLWLLVGTWAASNLTDGKVPDYIPEELGGTPRIVADLVAAGLWEVEDEGHSYPNWSEYQPSKEKVEERRDLERDRKAAWRAKQQQQTALSEEPVPDMSHGDTNGQERRSHGDISGVPALPSRPVPSRPVPSSSISLDDFAEFWQHYPRKVAKGAAETAYKRARTKVDHQRIMSSLAVFCRAQQGQDVNFICHASTWLNQGRWDDNPEDIRPDAPDSNQRDADGFMARAMARAQAKMGETA